MNRETFRVNDKLGGSKYVLLDDPAGDHDAFVSKSSRGIINRAVAVTVLLSVIGGAVFLWLFLMPSNSSGPSVDDVDDSCYVYPACIPLQGMVETTHLTTGAIGSSSSYDGFTNVTGWSMGSSFDGSCCPICSGVLNSTVCFAEAAIDFALGIPHAHAASHAWIRSARSTSSEYFTAATSSDAAAPAVVGTCSSKLGIAGDFDYLMFDQMWLPQFCTALAEGHDPTLSHLAGTTCSQLFFDVATAPPSQPPAADSLDTSTSFYSTLSIHGMWPQYVDGYPQCCKNGSGSSGVSVPPLFASKVTSWAIWPNLEQHWVDPTSVSGPSESSADLSYTSSSTSSPSSASFCSVCYLLNHEWQKHGSCYAKSDAATTFSFPSSATPSPVTAYLGEQDPELEKEQEQEQEQAYFSGGLALARALSNITAVVNSMNGTIQNSSTIAALYPKRVNVICDPQSSVPAHIFSSLSTFTRNNNANKNIDNNNINASGRQHALNSYAQSDMRDAQFPGRTPDLRNAFWSIAGEDSGRRDEDIEEMQEGAYAGGSKSSSSSLSPSGKSVRDRGRGRGRETIIGDEREEEGRGFGRTPLGTSIDAGDEGEQDGGASLSSDTADNRNMANMKNTENTGVFLEVQSCWSSVPNSQQMGAAGAAGTGAGAGAMDAAQLRDTWHYKTAGIPGTFNGENVRITGGFENMLDCPAAATTPYTEPCPEYVYLRNYEDALSTAVPSAAD